MKPFGLFLEGRPLNPNLIYPHDAEQRGMPNLAWWIRQNPLLVFKREGEA